MARTINPEWQEVLRAAKSLSDAAVKKTLGDPAPNKISYTKRIAIERLASDGMGMRAIARELKISPNTVDRYFPREAMCGCGRRTVDHHGLCGFQWLSRKARRSVSNVG